MTVGELISILEQYDGNMEIRLSLDEGLADIYEVVNSPDMGLYID